MENEKIPATYRGKTVTIHLDSIQPGDLTTGQAEKAADFDATHYFKTADTQTLPKYKHDALTINGWVYTRIGHTSYKSATWGAKKLA